MIASEATTLPAAHAPSGHRFRPDIQGLRAVAVVAVILYHARIAPFTGGYVGVDVFFVISGFVITGYLLRREEQDRRISMPAFYANRARRIIPAASLVIVVTVIATYHFLGVTKGNQTADYGLWSSVFLSDFHAIAVGTSYFGAVIDASPLQHFWSLAVEEQFYLVFPLLFVLAGALMAPRRFRRGLAALLVVAVVTSFLLGTLQTSSSPVVAYFSPFTRAWELALGAVLALGIARWERIPQAMAAVIGWVGLGVIVVITVAYSDATPYPGVAVLLPVLGSAMVVVAGCSSPQRGPALVLGLWPAMRIGDMSYSLYLWHFPILIIAFESSSRALPRSEKLGLLVAIFVVSACSYAFVENPVRRSPALVGHTGRSLGLGAVLVAITVAVCAIVIASHHVDQTIKPLPGPRSVSLATLTQQLEQGAQRTSLALPVEPPVGSTPRLYPPSMASHCVIAGDSPSALDTSWTTPCAFGDGTRSHTIVLFGDSQAQMWTGAFQGLVAQHHERLVVLSKSACSPWLDQPTKPGGGPFPACQAFRTRALAWIRAAQPAQVFVTGDPTQLAADPGAINGLLAALMPSTSAVDVLGPIPWYGPNWGGLDPMACLEVHATAIQQCAQHPARFLAEYGTDIAAMRTAARNHQARYVNVLPLFCTAQRCPTEVAHRLVYLDSRHMTWVYAEYLATSLGELVGR
jgi:peptidoglycan/LPS O-acetylase OafA/YrhL